MAAWTKIFCAALIATAGCAQMTESQCRASDWYQVGYRDADLYGLRTTYYNAAGKIDRATLLARTSPAPS